MRVIFKISARVATTALMPVQPPLFPKPVVVMASAVGAFMRAFGIDEPMGCYDDLEHADAFVLWGANMAEMLSTPE